MKEYFYKKEYKYMYLSIFFYNFANALSETFGTVFASCLVAWGVISDNTLVLFTVIAIFFILQYITVLKIDYKPEKKSSTFKASIKYLIHSKSKYKIIYALRTNHIIERLFVPSIGPLEYGTSKEFLIS